MAGSSVRENNADVRAFVTERNIRTVLDVGPGRGTYHKVIGDLVDTMDAVEAWRPYVHKYGLRTKYRNVKIGDIRNHHTFDYDLVIFGDILEHISRDEALDVWGRVAGQAGYGLISVPIVHYPQGPLAGNPYEVHKQEDLTPGDIRGDYGPFVLDETYEITGTFIRQFRSPQ